MLTLVVICLVFSVVSCTLVSETSDGDDGKEEDKDAKDNESDDDNSDDTDGKNDSDGDDNSSNDENKNENDNGSDDNVEGDDPNEGDNGSDEQPEGDDNGGSNPDIGNDGTDNPSTGDSDDTTSDGENGGDDESGEENGGSATPDDGKTDVDDPKEDDPKEDDPKEDDPKEDDPKEDDPKEDDPKEDDPKEDEDVTPAVTHPIITVLDGDGNPKGSLIIKLYSGTSSATMTTTNKQGVAEFSKLPLGDYTFEIISPSGESFHYDKSECVLTEKNPEVTIRLYAKIGNSVTTVYGPAIEGDNGAKAKEVTKGAFAVDIKAGMNYFVFQPDNSGIYEITFASDVRTVLGNYGIPNYVQGHDISESDGEGFTLEVTPLEGDLSVYTPYVVGISCDEACSGILKISRVGELSDNPVYLPWIEYTAKMPLTKYTVPAGSTFEYIDVTDPSVNVVLGSDGYYHLGTATGPIIVVNIKNPLKTLDGSIFSGSLFSITENTNFGGYIYDGDTFVKKERFNALIEAYAEMCDETHGCYPLTEELAYALKTTGEAKKWWKVDGAEQIFGNEILKVVQENAWLFACGVLK